MKKALIPIVLIGLFLTIIGLDVLFAPDAIIVTPAHAIAFDEFGRTPLGIILTISGILCLSDAWSLTKRYWGVLAGFLNATFWFLVTLGPLWQGNSQVQLFGFTVEGTINSVSTLAWALIALLTGYYWIKLRQGA
jgi:hypothetical protein